jgi:chaperone BCS1
MTPRMDDVTMQSMASSVPQGAILLIEDIDCAFPSRDADSEDENEDASPVPIYSPYVNGKRRLVTMSGLLNLMDGVGSDDHRIIFATVSSHFPSQHWLMPAYVDQLLREARPCARPARSY